VSTLSKIEPIPSSCYVPAEPADPTEQAFLQRLAISAIAVGLVLRVAQYLLNRSLWMDEAYLSLNILHRSFAGLWHPLDYHQGAPIGFLMLEKSAVQFWGGSEYILRFVPLMAGLVSVMLFYTLAKRTLTPRAVPIATGLFAISPTLIYYSAEVKQYSMDAAIAVLLWFLTIEGSESKWNMRQSAVAALLGAAAVWMSHASIFVLAGIGLTMSIALFLRKDWARLARVSAIGLCWVASLAACYFLTLRRLAGDSELLSYWKNNFMPLPPRSVTDLKWFVDIFFDFFGTSAGLKFAGLAAFVFVVGSIVIYRKSVERAFLLLSPAILTLMASGLHKYPFGGRLTLFFVPAVLLLMAEGTELLRSSTSSRLPSAGVVLLALLFLDPGLYLLHHFAKPHTEVEQPGVMRPEEIRPVLAYIRNHENPGDLVYVFYGSEPAFEYYAERYNFPRNNVEIGSASGNDPHRYEADLDALRGHRSWVVLSHTHGAGAEESRDVLFYLDSLGPRVECFARAGAETCLYDLRAAIAPTAGFAH
jgi:hypothetical protein